MSRDNIRANFDHQYPGASDIDWEKDGLEYTTSFSHKYFTLSAT